MIECDKCKKKFNPEVRTWQIDKDVEEVFFNCPNCNKRYTVYYTNDKIKKLQKSIKIIMPKHHGKTAIMKQMENEMNRLEELIGTQ